MNTKVIKEWIKALRSGEYKQCKMDLHNGDKFCAMGVLCDIHVREIGGKWIKDEHRSHYKYKGRRCTLHSDVREWAEWEVIAITHGIPSVTQMNDSEDRDFEYIAEQLEIRMNDYLARGL